MVTMALPAHSAQFHGSADFFTSVFCYEERCLRCVVEVCERRGKGEVRVLSLTEPWATLVALKEKQFETRSWLTHYRGPICIQAARTRPAHWQEFFGLEPFATVLNAHHLSGWDDIGWRFGSIIAVANLTGCYEVAAPTMEEIHKKTIVDLPVGNERAFGNYADGRFIFKLEDMHRLQQPVLVRGFQKIFRVQL